MEVSISHKLGGKKQFGIVENLKEVVILLKQGENPTKTWFPFSKLRYLNFLPLLIKRNQYYQKLSEIFTEPKIMSKNYTQNYSYKWLNTSCGHENGLPNLKQKTNPHTKQKSHLL